MTIPFKRQLRALHTSTFFMNALYLMMSTFVVAGSGFVFWLLITGAYAVPDVGLATTLISVSGLLSLLGLTGLDTTFVRFLPNSDRKNDYISGGFTIVTFASAGLAICVGTVLPFISPDLTVLSNDWAFVGFVGFTIISSLNILTNAIFLAYKRALYILVISVLLGVAKVILPLFATHGSAMTIFVIAGTAQLLGLILGLLWIRRKFTFRFSVMFDMRVLRMVRKFSFSTYAASILNLLPPTILPLLIVYHMGSANAAYYYMAFTIASALYTIAYASMQSVFAEGSHNQAAIRGHIIKAIKLVGALLVPALIIVALFSNVLLGLFGKKYADAASPLLTMFALGALPVAAYSAMGALFKVTKNLRGILCMNIAYAATILGTAFWLTPDLGLTAIGWAWISGNVAACLVGALFLGNNKKIGAWYGKTTGTRR